MLGVIVGLILFAFIPAFIAKGKGRSFFLWYLYGFFLFLFAFIHALIIKPNEHARGMKKCPKCSSIISESAVICPSCRTEFNSTGEGYQQSVGRGGASALYNDFDGETDIKIPAYQLYLTRRYGIEKNNTLDKYVIGNDVYDSLEQSLVEADNRYKANVAEKESTEMARRELADKQAKEVEIRAKHRAEKGSIVGKYD